jgi:hypothetical protein
MLSRSKTIESFSRSLGQLNAHFKELLQAINNKKNEASLGNELAIQTTLSSLVLWENFINDLLLVYAEADPSRVLKTMKARILQSVEAKFGRSCGRYVLCRFPLSISARTIAAMVDDKGMNITARTATDLASRANEILSGRYACRFTLEPRDSQFYDYVISIRNYLGHYSRKALRSLRETIYNMGHNDNAVFQAQFKQIGPYLRVDIYNGTCRTQLINQRLEEIARRL